MFYLGTSGFSYNDWAGVFYPRGLPRREWLSYYAREFNTLELNATFYAMPRLSMLESMVKKTPEGFLFSVKASQEITHQYQGNQDIFIAFRQILETFFQAGRLGCVLAQFPYSFHCHGQNREYLKFLRDQLRGIPLVVEFRNAGWLGPEVFSSLRELNIGFCCVDEPALAGLIGDIAYVRFHGRNREKWWQHEHAWERYYYTYSEAELKEWLPRIAELSSKAKKVFLFANNHWHGQAVNTIRQLKIMLD